MPKLKSSSLVFVSSNERKLKEYQVLLSLPNLKMSRIQIVDSQDLSLDTLVRRKIDEAKKILLDTPFFVEHSGIVFTAWNNKLPGGFTGPMINEVGVSGLCKMLSGFNREHDRVATAITVLGYFYNNTTYVTHGTTVGTIVTEPRSADGFGWDWDSIFIPKGESRTFAEMLPEEKNRLSMRMEATKKFKEECLSLYFEDIPTTSTPTSRTSYKVLFVASEPTDSVRLRLGEEFRIINEELRAAKYRDRVTLDLPQLSARPGDISRALLNDTPQIVHFAGHGEATGELRFENEQGKSAYVQPQALSALFQQFKNEVKCVVLNACYSEIQAKAIAEHIEYVIGMNNAIGDIAAITFTGGFYRALGAGWSIEQAYNHGCVDIQMHNLPEHLTPVLLTRGQT